MARSSSQADVVLNHEFRSGTAPKDANVWVGLLIGGVELTPGVGGYIRFLLAVADGQWSAPATSGGNRVISNTTVWSFGTATSALGTPDGYAYYSASTGGTMRRKGTIGTPRSIANGDAIQIPVGAVTVSEAFVA